MYVERVFSSMMSGFASEYSLPPSSVLRNRVPDLICQSLQAILKPYLFIVPLLIQSPSLRPYAPQSKRCLRRPILLPSLLLQALQLLQRGNRNLPLGASLRLELSDCLFPVAVKELTFKTRSESAVGVLSAATSKRPTSLIVVKLTLSSPVPRTVAVLAFTSNEPMRESLFGAKNRSEYGPVTR